MHQANVFHYVHYVAKYKQNPSPNAPIVFGYQNSY